MRVMSTVIVFCLVVLTLSCYPVSVRHDYDPDADFSGLKTYDWLSIKVGSDVNPLNVERIKNAVISELGTKGFKISSENPDFKIAVHIQKKEKIQVNDYGYGYGAWDGPDDVTYYEEGTLILDFIDSKSMKAIWRGVGTTVVGTQRTPEKQMERINKAVAKILKDFPPTPKE